MTPDIDPSFCEHLQAITEVKLSDEHVCEECIKQGTQWFHLRTCQTCGITLCCDQSDETHMTKHYHAERHPVIASAQPDERWLWCYVDEQFVEY
ncbi:UBP-type zinc finger domain-containing protein [Mucilaginibacter aquariorum]|uniref:UBP-type zinc finger domain-containing protein n=1 Tax=Mucilaginibacter aquariorum TaxID=2967225 RepID=A0ABT1SX76_9SPHI|nr:UBP-type zinc finger domain-containing protein [Mucilaginibacter aquariorum]MCQ6956956.1 UBP-type zinc finger domain-containing protein [Mucilaginibacter aquariorum]